MPQPTVPRVPRDDIPDDLDAHYSCLELSERPCSECRGRHPGRELYEVGGDHLTFFEGDELCRSCATSHGVL